MPEDERVPFQLELTICDRTINAHINVPTAPMRVADLLPILHAFDDAVLGMAADKTGSDGKTISCGAGCGACCRQLTPIAESEAVYLAEIVAAAPAERRNALRERFRAAVEALGEDLADRLRDTAKLETMEKRRAIGEEYFARGVACPFLEEESCSIHPQRPMSCREYLVTSPAENCRKPSASTIQTVETPLKLSPLLYRFGDGAGKDRTRWLPLALALEWAGSEDERRGLRWPGTELFKRFTQSIR
jgi:Fe-S-cluster containining protein